MPELDIHLIAIRSRCHLRAPCGVPEPNARPALWRSFCGGNFVLIIESGLYSTFQRLASCDIYHQIGFRETPLLQFDASISPQ